MEENIFIQQEAIAAAENPPFEKEVADVLNRVIAKSINSQEEFLTFAGKAESQTLYKLCMEIKSRREEFLVALQHRVTSMGYEPATEENFVGWIHHVWTRARLKLEADTDFVIVSEAVREEESMTLALSDAMNEVALPYDLQNAFDIEKEFSQKVHGVMVKLKDQLKPSDYIDANRE